MAHIKTLAIVTLAATATAFASSAMAQEFHSTQAGTGSHNDANVNLYGHVDATCNITGDPVNIDLQGLTDSNDQYNGKIGQQSAVTLSGWCNGASSKLSIKASPVTTSTSAPQGFTNSVDYTAKVTLGSGQNAKNTSDDSATSGSSSGVTVGAFAGIGNLSVTFSNDRATGYSAGQGQNHVGAANPLLVAGNYSGQTIVTLTPGL